MTVFTRAALATLLALSIAACATQAQPDLTPPPTKVKDAKYDLESGKPRR